MSSINAGGSFYRVQNALDQNSLRLSQTMQRLSSGKQDISPGQRTASVAVAAGVQSELGTIKIGIQNGTEALQALEMVVSDIQTLNDMVVRLEELNALGENGLNTSEDTAAIKAEATSIITEFAAVQTRATWKGTAIFGGAASVKFGRNTTALTLTAGATTAVTTPALITASTISVGTADGASAALYSSTGLGKLKENVDALQITAGANFNIVTNTLAHLSNLKAGYSIDLASKQDVDFAGETTELAKGQILAQAGTAMLAQANAQGQGLLALIAP